MNLYGKIPVTGLRDYKVTQTGDRFGLQQATDILVFSTLENFVKFVPYLNKGMGHFLFPGLQYVGHQMDRENLFPAVTIRYEGLLAGAEEPEPVYERYGNLGNEPIQTHSNFAAWKKAFILDNNEIIGWPDIFGTQNSSNSLDISASDAGFSGLTITAGSPATFAGQQSSSGSSAENVFRGQRDFLDISAYFKKTSVRRNPLPDWSRVGLISAPEDSPTMRAPSLAGKGNWLMNVPRETQRGSAFFIEQEWFGSGPKGWNPYVYGSRSGGTTKNQFGYVEANSPLPT